MHIDEQKMKQKLILWKIKYSFQVMQVFGQYYIIKIIWVLIVIEMELIGNNLSIPKKRKNNFILNI